MKPNHKYTKSVSCGSPSEENPKIGRITIQKYGS
jgi:hypothetical protein